MEIRNNRLLISLPLSAYIVIYPCLFIVGHQGTTHGWLWILISSIVAVAVFLGIYRSTPPIRFRTSETGVHLGARARQGIYDPEYIPFEQIARLDTTTTPSALILADGKRVEFVIPKKHLPQLLEILEEKWKQDSGRK